MPTAGSHDNILSDLHSLDLAVLSIDDKLEGNIKIYLISVHILRTPTSPSDVNPYPISSCISHRTARKSLGRISGYPIAMHRLCGYPHTSLGHTDYKHYAPFPCSLFRNARRSSGHTDFSPCVIIDESDCRSPTMFKC